MAKKEDKQQMYIYAGMPVPELMLRKGKIYNTIPNLPEEFKFLKEFALGVSVTWNNNRQQELGLPVLLPAMTTGVKNQMTFWKYHS